MSSRSAKPSADTDRDSRPGAPRVGLLTNRDAQADAVEYWRRNPGVLADHEPLPWDAHMGLLEKMSAVFAISDAAFYPDGDLTNVRIERAHFEYAGRLINNGLRFAMRTGEPG